MPEIVFIRSIEIKDIINLASSYKERIRLRNISEDLSGNLLDALEGLGIIPYRPVNPRDISPEKAESFIPDRLYTFIYCILSAK